MPPKNQQSKSIKEIDDNWEKEKEKIFKSRENAGCDHRHTANLENDFIKISYCSHCHKLISWEMTANYTADVQCGFPYMKTHWFSAPTPYGWEDLGKVDESKQFDEESKQDLYSCQFHKFCNSRIHIGKENGELFKFCPRCLIKIVDK